MEQDDAVYLLLFFFSIAFGPFYRKIRDPEWKKWVGSAIGFLIMVISSGFHVLHPIVTFLLNTALLQVTSKSYCHVVSFFATFSYLMFFRVTEFFGIPYPPAHTNIIQMFLTLKLTGLAFDLNNAYVAQKKKRDCDDSDDLKDEIEFAQVDPNFRDIFHYSFNYAGILAGPYYKYRTFHDSIYTPFSQHANCLQAAIKKLIWLPLYCLIFLFIETKCPNSYIFTEEFYTNHSWLYRLWYNLGPTFMWFKMRIYVGLILAECGCIMAGLGAYPVSMESKPGAGPQQDFRTIIISKQRPELTENLTYDFNTVYNMNPYGSEFCITFREGMKHWNMCIQYWLAVNIYRKFPIKSLRVFAVSFVSAVWHGVYLGHYFCLLSVPFCLIVEDFYIRTFRKSASGWNAIIWDIVLWTCRIYTYAYFSFAFQLLTMENVWRYYNSVYHVGELSLIVAYVLGVIYKKNYVKKVPSNNNKIK